MRNSDTLKAEKVAGILRKPVAELVDESRMYHHAENTDPVRAGGDMQHCAGKGHMPNVPDIDVHNASHPGHQHEDVDCDSDRNRHQCDLRCPGHRRRPWPTNINHVQVNLEMLRHRFRRRADRVEHQADDQADTDETNPDMKA